MLRGFVSDTHMWDASYREEYVEQSPLRIVKINSIAILVLQGRICHSKVYLTSTSTSASVNLVHWRIAGAAIDDRHDTVDTIPRAVHMSP